MDLKNKIVLISGAGQGIGAAIARRFFDEEAIVCVSDMHLAPAEALVSELEGTARTRTVPLKLDVTQLSDWQHAVSHLTERHGGVDVLINNAGIYENLPLETIGEDSWDRMMAVNAKGPFLGTRAVMASMRSRGGGAIVNVSSMAGITGSVATHYCASKGAVRLMTKSVALIGAKDNIRCNCVHPGMVETTMAQAAVARPGARDERLARLPLGRFADPVEIANVVVFLASDEASFMTGAEIAVDGGAQLT